MGIFGLCIVGAGGTFISQRLHAFFQDRVSAVLKNGLLVDFPDSLLFIFAGEDLLETAMSCTGNNSIIVVQAGQPGTDRPGHMSCEPLSTGSTNVAMECMCQLTDST